MATATITLTTAGTGTGPFDLYSDFDGYVTPFETGVDKTSLTSGYTTSLVYNGTTIIRVKSNSVGCTNYVDLPVSGITTSTTTTSSTTTTTTIAPGYTIVGGTPFASFPGITSYSTYTVTVWGTSRAFRLYAFQTGPGNKTATWYINSQTRTASGPGGVYSPSITLAPGTYSVTNGVEITNISGSGCGAQIEVVP
jgi:hypothetical protein